MEANKGIIPEHIIRPEVRTFSTGMREISPGTAFDEIWRLLEGGYDILFSHTYGFTMAFYSWLKKRIQEKVPVRDYPSSRKHRQTLHTFQSKMWIPVRNHEPDLKKAPKNRWFKEFYPETPDFFITFSGFLGMNGARQWYEKGIRYDALTHPLHPFYGVYFPTRQSHLHLFDKWLGQAETFPRAVDIGTGCGVLSFMMHKHGIKEIHATDINPNAIYGLMEETERLGMSSGKFIFPEEADLLGSFNPAAGDLVVCNPPWIPGKTLHPLDQGSYYEEGFFLRFFEHLKQKCPPGTQVVIIFSNFAMVAGITDLHPIEEALETHHEDFELQTYDRMKVQDTPSKKRSWLQAVRDQERAELFVLQRK